MEGQSVLVDFCGLFLSKKSPAPTLANIPKDCLFVGALTRQCSLRMALVPGIHASSHVLSQEECIYFGLKP